jgi:ketosteroid isomerase-like protein
MIAVIAIGMHFAAAAASPRDDEQAIRALQGRVAAAVSARDLDAVMKEYIPGDELFVFDSDLPRQHRGWDAFKQDWGEFIAVTKDARYEVKDLGVTVVGDAAFSHHLADISWTARKNGLHHEQLMSMTDGYRKVGGKWLIVLEHFSVPVVDGKAVFVAWPKSD